MNFYVVMNEVHTYMMRPTASLSVIAAPEWMTIRTLGPLHSNSPDDALCFAALQKELARI